MSDLIHKTREGENFRTVTVTNTDSPFSLSATQKKHDGRGDNIYSCNYTYVEMYGHHILRTGSISHGAIGGLNRLQPEDLAKQFGRMFRDHDSRGVS